MVSTAGPAMRLLQRSMPSTLRRLPRLVHLRDSGPGGLGSTCTPGVARRSFTSAATQEAAALDAMPEQDKFLFDLNGYAASHCLARARDRYQCAVVAVTSS